MRFLARNSKRSQVAVSAQWRSSTPTRTASVVGEAATRSSTAAKATPGSADSAAVISAVDPGTTPAGGQLGDRDGCVAVDLADQVLDRGEGEHLAAEGQASSEVDERSAPLGRLAQAAWTCRCPRPR